MADTGKAKRDAGDAEAEEEEEEEGGDSLAPLPAVGRPSRGGSRGSLTAGAGAGAGASNDTAAVPTASAAPPPPPTGSGGARKSRARSVSVCVVCVCQHHPQGSAHLAHPHGCVTMFRHTAVRRQEAHIGTAEAPAHITCVTTIAAASQLTLSSLSCVLCSLSASQVMEMVSIDSMKEMPTGE